MDFQLQLADGSWQESKSLPLNPTCYKKAILLDEHNQEVLVLEPKQEKWTVKQ